MPTRGWPTIVKVEWLRSLAYPAIGDHSIREIDAPAILKALIEAHLANDALDRAG